MNRRKFVKWIAQLPPGVWLSANWSFFASRPKPPTEIVFLRRGVWRSAECPRCDENGRELWWPLTPQEIHKVMQYFRRYNPRVTWEDAFAKITALAEEKPDDNGQTSV